MHHLRPYRRLGFGIGVVLGADEEDEIYQAFYASGAGSERYHSSWAAFLSREE